MSLWPSEPNLGARIYHAGVGGSFAGSGSLAIGGDHLPRLRDPGLALLVGEVDRLAAVNPEAALGFVLQQGQVAAGNLAVLPVGSLAGGCRIILRGGWRRLLLRRAGRRGLRLARRRRRSDADWLGLDVARRLRRVMHAPLGVGPFVDLLRPGAAEAEEEKTSDDGDAHGDAPRFSLLLPGRLCVSLGADKVKPITPRRFP